MAQTRKRRRRKHRGTQGGRIDTRRRGARPRSRQEARARVRSQRTSKIDRPPSWRSATNKGLIAAAILVLIMVFLTKNAAQAIFFGLFALVFYIPLTYMTDSFVWRRRQRAKLRAREKSS